jgi:hypothetical protein
MNPNALKVIDRYLAGAVRNLLQIGRARDLPVRGVVEEWLARSDGQSAVEDVNRAFGETIQDASEPAQGAVRDDYPPEQPEAAPGVPWVDLEAVRQRMRTARDGGTTMAALARDIGISPQGARNILAGSEPYAKTKVTLADWMAGS